MGVAASAGTLRRSLRLWPRLEEELARFNAALTNVEQTWLHLMRSIPMRTLIVEDDFTSRLLLQSLLSKYGECHIAVNGREAVAAFRAVHESGQDYQLICMDSMMPEMDGQTAVREVRSLEESGGILSTNDAKIIMTTALDDGKNVVQSFRKAWLQCTGSLCVWAHKMPFVSVGILWPSTPSGAREGEFAFPKGT
jgi:two-component system chemotaxis response regulator CheY